MPSYQVLSQSYFSGFINCMKTHPKKSVLITVIILLLSIIGHLAVTCGGGCDSDDHQIDRVSIPSTSTTFPSTTSDLDKPLIDASDFEQDIVIGTENDVDSKTTDDEKKIEKNDKKTENPDDYYEYYYL